MQTTSEAKVSLRRAGATLGVCVLLGSLLTGLGMRRAVAAPPGGVLVVTANLQEAYGMDDLARMPELGVFVRRLKENLPRRPDVLLLQEVRGKSASKVAALLSHALEATYRVAVNPGPRPTITLSGRKMLHTDTSILLNTDTMAKASKGGYVKLGYRPRHRARGTKVAVRKQAYLLAQHEASGSRFALASIHLLPKRNLNSRVQFYRDKWVRKLVGNLRARYNAPIVLGGDFNHDYCAHQVQHECRPISTFYKTLTNGYGLTDAVRSVIGGHGVDFVFSRPGVLDAGKDGGYDWRGAMNDPDRYYADHQFRWAAVATD